jgi:transcriptional regulator with XRE-family HTH domain
MANHKNADAGGVDQPRRTHEVHPALREFAVGGLRLLGEHIRRARKEGFRESREAFAKRIGCTPPTLDKLENGDPGVSAMYLMAALHVMTVLPDVVNAANPHLFIATSIPATFPPGFGAGSDFSQDS